jgi:hypothetical protein
MVGKKPVFVRDAGWNYGLDGQPGFEFSRTINLIRAASAHDGDDLATAVEFDFIPSDYSLCETAVA